MIQNLQDIKVEDLEILKDEKIIIKNEKIDILAKEISSDH